MINYNLELLGSAVPMMSAIALYVIIMLSLAFGNFISVKLLKPKFKDAGRIFYGALIVFSTNIFLVLVMHQIRPWGIQGISASTILIYIIVFLVANIVAFYFETKYLFDYDWGKAIVAVIIPLVIVFIVIGILWYTVPGDWVKNSIFPTKINLLQWLPK